jgi:hypothetical protein
VSGPEEVRYEIDFGSGKPGPIRKKLSANPNSRHGGASRCAVSRIARLMALALRFEGLLREQTMQDYAELARVTPRAPGSFVVDVTARIPRGGACAMRILMIARATASLPSRIR